MRGGHGARGLERLLERRADRDEVPDRLDHRQRAAGEHAVLAADDVVGDHDLDLAERVRPVAEPGARDRVRDERHAAGRDPPEQPHDVRVEVDAVDDRLDDDLGPHERCADDPGVAVQQRSHRVEDVRHRPHAAVEGGVCLDRRRVGVAEGDDDPAGVQQVDQLERPGQLRGERDERDGPGREQSLDQRGVGIATRSHAVRAETGRGEERAPRGGLRGCAGPAPRPARPRAPRRARPPPR